MKLKTSLITAVVTGVLLSGCTVNPYTGEKQVSKAASIGGVSAAVCGALGSRKNRETALKYAAICGLAGAGVGVYMDTQEAKLRQELEGTVSKVLAEFDDTDLLVGGHTDSTGKMDTNMDLSRRRAQSVADYLGSRGVMRERLSARGYGPNMPVADNNTEAGKQANRRVELDLVPREH